MKVLLISNLYPNAAQPERGIFTQQKLVHLKDRVDFKVISPVQYFPFVQSPSAPPTGRVPAREVIDGIDVYHPRAWYLPRVGRRVSAKLYASSIRPVVRLLYERQPFDLIWATWGYPDIVAAVALAEELGVPVLASLHGSDVNYGFQHSWSRAAMMKAFLQATAVIVRSHAMEQLLIRSGLPRAQVFCLYNGVDRERFHPLSKAAACAVTGLDPERPRILYVGNFVEVKGLPTLIKAFANLKMTGAKLPELVLIGSGVEKVRLEEQASRLRVADRVRFLGQIRHPELCAFYNSSDLLCLPSLNEGLPNVVLEAFACGLPVVASHVGGVPELIVEGILGAMAPPGDAPALTKALATVLSNPIDRVSIADHAQRFDWRQVADKLFELFQYSAGQASRPVQPGFMAPVQSPGHPLGPQPEPTSRLLLISRMFPSYRDPTFGQFNFQLGHALSRHFNVEVVSPLSALPGRLRDTNRVQYAGLIADYPRYLGVRFLNRLIGGYCLDRCLSHFAYDAQLILASFVWPDGYAAVKLGERLQIPVIVQAIGSDIDQLPLRGLRRAQTLVALHKCAHIYAVSESLRQRMIELGLPAGKITTIHNGIDATLFQPRDQSESRRSLDLPTDERIVVYCGWISPDKGIDYLLRALAQMTSPPLVLFIGADRSNGQMARLATELGLAQRCRFVGTQPHENIPRWLNAADVFTFPSLHEGCPNVVLEALACGLPMVATNVGGIPEITPRAPWCELVPPRNSKALATALERLLAGAWDRQQIARASQRTWDDVARDVYQLCQSVVGHSGDAANDNADSQSRQTTCK